MRAQLVLLSFYADNRGPNSVVATSGTAALIRGAGVPIETINKVREGSPHIVDLLGQGDIQMVIKTPEGWGAYLDSRSIGFVANELDVLTYTTLEASAAAVAAIKELQRGGRTVEVRALQEYHRELRERNTGGVTGGEVNKVTHSAHLIGGSQ